MTLVLINNHKSGKVWSIMREKGSKRIDVGFVVLCTLNRFDPKLVVKACPLKIFTAVNTLKT